MRTDDIAQNQDYVTGHTVALTATLAGNKVKISGEGGAVLKADSGAHRFDFILTSPPGVVVQFDRLDTQDDCSTCPPAPGENSKQIVGVQIGSNTASFTDNNNNSNGPMDVSYQWHFKCNDPKLSVETFDPIIKNGGTTTPPGGGG